MSYTVIDIDTYYRKGVFKHFKDDCKCSLSITARIDVTKLVEYSKKTDTKFYINFLYLLSKVLNSRDDYKYSWMWQTKQLVLYDTINPIQYVFHEDTETCNVCILIIILTILSFMRKLWRIWKKLRKATNTHWKQRVIQTGLMHPLYLGSAMIA